ncbi:type 2 periplasmic-binding domain-containing protein [Anaerocolumna xylanovorans]|uniref:Putative aldouronate transport system substrate-binding protein n=1 Tax=Anaerocolumna xylanovorans DSM 12503 TaxID=1121345 RepID=A0A1M7Y5B9_9FIRM|nr:extracellular solute-binding protein [Anaerocolumna xylanovorans]SHO47562.1 putative aldouronate transport system substrate-binding protein [Anaerocolumna xylanovorans DSM 12503]
MKKTVLLFTAVLALSLIFTGCGNEKKEVKKTDSNSNEFSVLAVRGVKSGDEYLQGFVKESQAKVGITVDWNIQNGSDWGDKKSVFLTGSDLPDAFFGGNVLQDSDIAQNIDLFIPLEKYIDENMPNLKKIMEADPKVKAMITSEDGHIYSLPKRMPGRPVVGNQLFINKTWLDNLGLEMPTTYKELENVLEKFKTEDPNQNGKNDEVPMTGTIYRIMTLFGVQYTSSSVNYMNWDPENNTVLYNPVTDNYKEAINQLNYLYKNQLLDQEIFTTDNSQIGAKRMNSEIALVGVSDGWLPTAFGPNADQYVPLPAIEAPDGKKYVMMDQDPYGRNQFLVTKNCDNPAKLLEWVDQFYTDDATVETYYGDFGVATEKNDDGTYTILPGKDMAQSSYSEIMAFRDEGPKYVDDNFTSKLIFKTLDGDGGKLEITKDLEPYAVENYPQVMYTVDEQKQLSSLNTDIQGYVDATMAQWITKGGADKEWESYKSQLKNMGLEEFLKIQQDALDRFTKNTK